MRILSAALIVVLLAWACSKSEQTAMPLQESSVQDATIPTKTTPTALQLSQDYNFKSLLKISEGIAGNSTNSALDAVKQVDIYGRHYLSNAQYVALAKGLGYTDTLCFHRALDQMVTYATAVNNRYYLSQDLVGAARRILYGYFPAPCNSCYTCYTGGGGTGGGGTGGGGTAIMGDPRIERLAPSDCCDQAMVTYTFRIGECFGFSVLGGFTPVGAGIFLGCGCVAAYGLHLDRKACGGC
jgi:hypothetical protein